MAAPKLEWKWTQLVNGPVLVSSSTDFGNWVVKLAAWQSHLQYEVQGRFDHAPFNTVDAAKAWCQAREDEAWAAANPAKEYSDTEILDRVARGDLSWALNLGTAKIECWNHQTQSDFYAGNDLREAVTAYLRAHPPAKAAEHEPASEPEPEREITLRGLDQAIESNRLTCSIGSKEYPNRKFNVWVSGQAFTDRDCFGPTISEALTKCLAAIEAHKVRTGE